STIIVVILYNFLIFRVFRITVRLVFLAISLKLLIFLPKIGLKEVSIYSFPINNHSSFIPILCKVLEFYNFTMTIRPKNFGISGGFTKCLRPRFFNNYTLCTRLFFIRIFHMGCLNIYLLPFTINSYSSLIPVFGEGFIDQNSSFII